jgi:hypothetical protein
VQKIRSKQDAAKLNPPPFLKVITRGMYTITHDTEATIRIDTFFVESELAPELFLSR